MKFTLILVILFVALSSDSLKAINKPNVIVIMADDIGYEYYSHKGSEFYRTPNIAPSDYAPN